MTRKNFIDAVTELDTEVLDRYFTVKRELLEKKKEQKRIFEKWISIAACLCLMMTVCFVFIHGIWSPSQSPGDNVVGGEYDNNTVLNYGEFIFIPIVLVSAVSFIFNIFKGCINIKTANLVMFAFVNILITVLVMQPWGINIVGFLPIILVCANAGALFAVGVNNYLDKKIKSLWLKLLLWIVVCMVSVLFAAVLHIFLCGELIKTGDILIL